MSLNRLRLAPNDAPAADGGAAALPPPLIPRDVLFGNPERVSPQLSPDGRRLAYVAPREGVQNVWVRGSAIDADDAVAVTDDRTRPVRLFMWVENSRQIVYAQDAGGDENFHLYLADLETGAITDLTPFPEVQAGIVGSDRLHPDTIVITLNNRDPRLKDALRVDLKTGGLTLAAENAGDVVGWIADKDLRVRGALAYLPDGGTQIRIRDDEDSPWRAVYSAPFGDSAGPIGFSRDGTGLFLISSVGANTNRLYRMDLATGGLTLLSAREDVDLAGVLAHPTTGEPQAVSFVRGRREWVALDPAIAPDLEALRAAAEGDFGVVTRADADATWLVAYTRDIGSPAYYVYDRARRSAVLLFTAQPALDDYLLARTEYREIPAADGLSIPCYVTLPLGRDPRALPLVLSVHGGPWARDSWGYNPFVQWLANRGYAVLQVNFRGSTGFGKAYRNAGDREWAGKMQTDLYDAVDRLVAEGIADPSLVAILGGSYGGYATLVGMTMAPTRFACGVDMVGPSNIATLLASIPPYWEPIRTEFLLRVGNPETEPDFIRGISPLYHADRIERPLLIAQGANDPRVKQAESDQIVALMRGAGKEVLYLLFPDEGHGFARPENNIRFVAAAEAFLARHLGGRAEEIRPGEEPPIVEG
jgi:dipeptidyl aminopeptidase/acylaminoacyl peptidase